MNECFNQLQSAIAGLYDEHKKLSAELSRYDSSVSDILHKIEFSKMSASEGYKYSKLLQDIQIERRDIKNQMSVLASIIEKIKTSNLGDIKWVVNKLTTKLTNRKYTPRVLDI